jgi:hypothetical protein
MDVCHRCHDTVERQRPIIRLTDRKRPRVYCDPCFHRIRARCLSRLLRHYPAEMALYLLDTLPAPLPAAA